MFRYEICSECKHVKQRDKNVQWKEFRIKHNFYSAAMDLALSRHINRQGKKKHVDTYSLMLLTIT